MTTDAPPRLFTWNGGKRHKAGIINERLGVDLSVYAEPFAGRLDVMMRRPRAKREIACDLSGFIANFHRAVRDRAEETARAAVSERTLLHVDLVARARWLRTWMVEHAPRLMEDPDYCDPLAAARWASVQSLSIAGAER